LTLLINPIFWVVAIVVYLLLLIRLPGSLTFRFGLFNFLTLIILLGWEIASGVLGFVFFIWIAINLINLLKKNPTITGVSFLSIGLLSFLLFTFLLHKFNLASADFSIQLEKTIPWFPAETILPFFASISFSFIFVRCIDLIHSCVLKNIPLTDPISLIGYIAPFHMLVAGPVNIYKDHLEANKKPVRSITPATTLLIINEITTGLFYKFVLAEGIRVYFYGINSNILVINWIDSLILLIYVFFDFAGYSRIARGIGLLYGIPTPKNFNAPFLSTSVTDFFTRWHMSMGQFIRHNLFSPTQLYLVRKFGVKRAPLVSVISMMISFAFIGLWHRLSLTWFLWGIAMGALMGLEKFIQTILIKQKWNHGGGFKKITDLLGVIYVFFVMILSFYYFSGEVF
jgi:D-alanyl-lipoteichoic acid acyltransferase DltB (MBOAT superfamily)